MTSRALITVLMPVYNGERFLTESLNSILAQTDPQFELLVVNDGSTDGTAQILADACRDPRVRVLDRPHAGIVAALNAGLEAASGDMIARMDADDWCLPERLAAQRAAFEANASLGLVAAGVAYGGSRETHGGFAHYVDWTNRQITHDQIYQNRFVESPIIHPSVMFKKSVIQRVGPYRDGAFPEDYELWLRMLDAGVLMHKVADQLVGWRERPGRLSRVHPRYSEEAFADCKADWLARDLLKRGIESVTVWGAGRKSRKRAEPLVARGLSIRDYLDISPRKIGEVIHGRPVRSPETLGEPGETFVLSYVSNRGARDEIAAYLEARGFRAGDHYYIVA